MTRAGVTIRPSTWQGKCADCGQDIHLGDPVMELAFGKWTHGSVGSSTVWIVMHRDCGRDFGEDMSRA